MFEESGLERLQQFFDEEKIQWEREVLRTTEFEKLMTVVDETFLQKQNSRDVAFQSWDAEKEATYERNEIVRDTRFKVAEDRRDSLFQRDHDTHLARSEWYADIRLQHIQRGRHAREQACQQLEKEMEDQFEIISRFLDDALAAVERRDDPPVGQPTNQVTSSEIIISPPSSNHLVEDNVDTGNEVVSVTDAAPIEPHPAPPGVNEDSPTIYASILPNRSRSRSPRRLVSSLDLYPSQPTPVYIGHNPVQGLPRRDRSHNRHSRSRSWISNPSIQNRCSVGSNRSSSRRRSRTPPQPPRRSTTSRIYPTPARCRTPSPVLPVVNYVAAENGVDVTPNMTPLQDPKGSKPSPDSGAGGYSERFFSDQHFQEYHFSLQEDHRTRRFELAEAQRDRAEASRTEDFNITKGRHTQIFEAAMRANEEGFRYREQGRHWREDARGQQFATSQRYHLHMYDEHLAWVQKKDSAIHAAEVAWIHTAKKRIETISGMHNMVLEQRRQALTRTPSHQQLPPTSPRSEFSSPRQPIVIVQPPQPLIIPSRPHSRSHFRYYSPSPQRRHREQSRSRSSPITMAMPIGFAPQTLATRDLGAHLPLPGSPGRGHNKERPIDDVSNEWISAQRKRQFTFEKSQSERSRIFEYGMKHRRCLFETSEDQRQHEFKEGQQTRKASSAEAEHSRNVRFGDVQARLEEIFRRAEEMRESAFHDAERKREEAFQARQAERKQAFYRSQEDLQTNSFDQENIRASEFDSWWKASMASAKTMVRREKQFYFLKEQKHGQENVGLNQERGSGRST